jgi:hypothetical protein
MDIKVMFNDRKRRRKGGFEPMRCNLCNRAFRAASRFHRFCKNCRLDEDLFRFSDWLPEGVAIK